MGKKIIWLFVSCLMVLSLVMASCAPAVVEEEEEVVEEEVMEEEEVEKEVVAPTIEVPEYGGMLRLSSSRDIIDFDVVVGKPWQAQTFTLTNEELMGGDWTKGAAGGYGTKETDWTHNSGILALNTGWLAESWEIPTKIEGETATVIWHIRQGVHWALNPASEASSLVGGREMTADDIAFSLNVYRTDERAILHQSFPQLRETKITAPDKWTVKMEFPWENLT
ncbi:hypothetical protein ACFLTO_05855, partial [Chloroflexota bacterium]